MLDNSAVHIQYIDRPVRRIVDIDRPEPLIGRGEKFTPLICKACFRLNLCRISVQKNMLDQVGSRFRSKYMMGAELLTKLMPAVDHRSERSEEHTSELQSRG